MGNKKQIIMATAAALALTACGTQRAAVATQQPATTAAAATTTDTTAQQQPVNHVSRIAQTFGTWSTMQAGGSVSLSGAKSLKLSVTVRMERDKSVYISVRPLGIMEAARVVVQGDTIVLLDRLHKRYASESVKSLLGGLPADVGTVQDLLLGRAFVLGQGTLSTANSSGVTMRKINGSYLLQPSETYRGYAYGFTFGTDYCISGLQLTKAQSDVPVCSVSYGDVSRTVAGNVAGWASVDATMGGSKLNFKLDYSSFSWNMAVNIDAKIPSNYTRVSAKTLLGSIGDL